MKKIFFIAIIFPLVFSVTPVYGKSIVTTNSTYKYEQLLEDLWELRNEYPKELYFKTIGYSHFGHKIYAIRLGKGKKNILIIGSHHGREWITTTLLMKMIEEYTKAYKNKENFGPYSTQILDDVSIWFVPMLNPDGVMIQQGEINKFPPIHQLNLIRMNEGSINFARWKANGVGIDLNRQYPAGWGKMDSEYKSPSYQFYKGTKPLEAKEVKAIIQFTEHVKPLIAVAYHSSGREIFWEYKNGIHKRRDRKIAKKAAKITKYKLNFPEDHAVGAGYTDWFITTYHKPGLTIEICPLVENTNPPLSTFDEEWDRNKYIGLMLIKESKKL